MEKHTEHNLVVLFGMIAAIIGIVLALIAYAHGNISGMRILLVCTAAIWVATVFIKRSGSREE